MPEKPAGCTLGVKGVSEVQRSPAGHAQLGTGPPSGISLLEALAVLLLASGPLLILVRTRQLDVDEPLWGFLVPLVVFGAVVSIAWKRPRGGGVLLLIASAVMSVIAIAAIEFVHDWEEESAWTPSEILWVVFLGGVPLAAGTLFLVAGYRAHHWFLVAGYRAHHSPSQRPAGRDDRPAMSDQELQDIVARAQGRSVAELSDVELQAIVYRAAQVWGWPPDIDWKPRDREAWRELENRKPTAARS